MELLHDEDDGFVGFVGKHDRALDDKHRLVLPAGDWRTALVGRAYLSPWTSCLALWTPSSYREVLSFLREQVRGGELDSDVLAAFREDTSPVTPDGQGRFVVPEEQRRYAGIAGEVVLSGQENHIQIWDRQRYVRRREDLSPETVATQIARLRF